MMKITGNLALAHEIAKWLKPVDNVKPSDMDTVFPTISPTTGPIKTRTPFLRVPGSFY